MSGTVVFRKALHLLDRGDLRRGEELLRQSIEAAHGEGDEVTEFGARACLGDLLMGLQRVSEALPFLQQVAALERVDDVLEYEVIRARELLASLGS